QLILVFNHRYNTLANRRHGFAMPMLRRCTANRLGSIGEESGRAGGVTPSISLCPSAWTMILVKVICASAPPSDSGIDSVEGRILARSPALRGISANAH